MKIEGDGQRIESRTKIGGGSGQYDLQRWLSRFDRQLRHGFLLCAFQCSNHRIRFGGEYQGGSSQLFKFSFRFFTEILRGEEVSAVEVQRVFGIFEQVAGQDQNHRFTAVDESRVD